MKYPNKIIVNDNVYIINTDYRVALSCFKALNDVDINDTERALAIVTLLLGKDVSINDLEECLEKCSIYLRCGKEVNDSEEELDMDYLQDEKAIRTSIRQCYHLDLNKKNMHWWEYNELIEGLTEDTLLSKIRELRTYDLSSETDENRKRKIEEAKQKVALVKKKNKLSEEEKRSIDKFCELMGFERG